MLLGSLALGVGTLGGCGRSPGPTLQVGAVTGSIPAYLPGAFKRFVVEQAATGAPGSGVTVTSLGSGKVIANTFVQWQEALTGEATGGLPGWVPFFGRQESNPTDLMLLGSGWLPLAIREGWIQKLDLTIQTSAQEAIADKRWQQVMTGAGEVKKAAPIFGMPYRWGTTVLVYRKDKVDTMGGPIMDWSDLWRSQLKGRVMLLDQAREVIGATLKSLGQSYNVADLDTVDDLGDRLEALHSQALAYSSTDYIQPLLMGDAWVAMGWSRDVLPVLARRGQLAAVVPQSGSALWADLWVQPTAAPKADQDNKQESNALRRAWIEFCWTPEIARRVTLQTAGASPQFLQGDWGVLAQDQQGSAADSIRFPNAEILEKCEFLLPLGETTRRQYQTLWKRLSSLG